MNAFAKVDPLDPEVVSAKRQRMRLEQLLTVSGRLIEAKRAPAALLTAMRESGAQLDRLLKHHEHLVGAMREASEGLVKAVAQGVEKIRTGDAPYTPVSKAKHASSSGAIVYNKVV
jgi:hypothetical protein